MHQVVNYRSFGTSSVVYVHLYIVIRESLRVCFEVSQFQSLLLSDVETDKCKKKALVTRYQVCWAEAKSGRVGDVVAVGLIKQVQLQTPLRLRFREDHPTRQCGSFRDMAGFLQGSCSEIGWRLRFGIEDSD